MIRKSKGVWIPMELWENEDLTKMEMLFLVEIDSLDNDNGCFASNDHFSKFFRLSKGRCSQIIKELERKKQIKVSLIREGKVISKRVIKVFNKINTPIKNTKHPYLENDEDNNTSINNTELYSKANFLKNWNQLRTSFLKTESNLNKLHPEELADFNQLVEMYSKEDFHTALKGLFQQESMPKAIMRFRPKHFLKNIDQYLDAEKNKNYKLYV